MSPSRRGRIAPSSATDQAGRPRPLRMLWITAAWGACFVTIRWGLRDAPVLWFAALRSLVAGTVLVALGLVQRRPLPPTTSSWARVALLGLVNSAVAFAAMFAGVDGLATGTAAVLANAQPLLIVLPAWWLFGERVTLRTAGALAVGFAGLVIVALPAGGGSGAWLALLAAGAITTGTLLSRTLGALDVVHVAGWHFVIGGVVLAGAASIVEGMPAFAWTPRFVVSLAFLALVGTALAFWAWFTEAQRCRLSELTAWTLVTPVFGLAFGIILVGERPSAWTAAGVGIVLVVLAVVVRPTSAGDDAAPSLNA